MTSGVDAVVALFAMLSAEERAEALGRLNTDVASERAGEHSETGIYLRSLKQVFEHLGREPSVADYKEAYAELTAAGEELKSFPQQVRYFGTWVRAKEAVAMTDDTTVRRIEERFASRRIGRVHRYTEQTLRETLLRAVEHHGRAPTVAEYDWWRDRELELARARGDMAFELPSSGPVRRQWNTWEQAMEAIGVDPQRRAARHESAVAPANRNPDAYLPKGLPVASMRGDRALGQLTGTEVWRLLQAWARLPRRTQYVLTVRLGLGGAPRMTLKETAAPLQLHLDRVRQLQVVAVDELTERVAEDGQVTAELRAAVEEALGQMATLRVRRPT